MAVEPTKPRVTGDVIMGDGTDLPSLSGDSWTEKRLQENHAYGVIAIQSIDQRVDLAVSTTTILGERMSESVRQLNVSAKRLTKDLSDENPMDANAMDFATQMQATVTDIYLKTLRAAHERKIGMAGSDIRKGIPPPPEPPKPPPVIVQQNTPRLREASWFSDIGKKKYVISD